MVLRRSLFVAIPGLIWAGQPAMAQSVPTDGAAAPAVQATPPGELDPESPLAPMEGIGVDWPDLGEADKEVALDPPSANDVADNRAVSVVDPVETATQNVEPTFDPAADYRYDVKLRGLDEVADTLFDDRFDALSALKTGDEPASIAQINRRAREDRELIDRLMRAKGYYDPLIGFGLAARPGNAREIDVNFDVAPGALYTLADVILTGLERTGEHQDSLRAAFPIRVGDPIDADLITGAQTSLALALGEGGFPFAKVGEPTVTIDHEARNGELEVDVDAGGYRRFGSIVVVTERPLFSARHVQRVARFRPEDPYKASDVEDLRRALVATGLVSSIKLTPVETGDDRHVDLQVDLERAPPRTIAGEIGYGTGEGLRTEVSWQHRNFFPPEGALTLRGVAGTQEQAAVVTFRRNNFMKRDQVLNAQIAATNINRAAYDARTVSLSGSIERQTNIIFQKKWVWSVGAEFLASDERDATGVLGATRRRTFLIAALPGTLVYDGSDDLLNPTSGFRLGGRLSPEVSFQNGTFTYVRAQVDGSVYLPFGDRVVVAGRSRLGTIFGSNATRIAPSRRFYAGGGGSVRGYGYQRIGPRDANNDPIGGKSLAEFSLEARVRFGNFGFVPFIDAGNISSTTVPKFDNLRFGAGIGLRYHTSFGPIRVDVGTPLNRQPGDSRIAVYVSLGQAF